jgi:hypothetical protein
VVSGLFRDQLDAHPPKAPPQQQAASVYPEKLLTLSWLSSPIPILAGGNALGSELVLLNLEGELSFLLACYSAAGDEI